MRTLLCQSSFLALVAVSSAAAQQEGTPVAYRPPVALDDRWKTAHADSVGIDSRGLARLTGAIRAWPELGAHAVLIERGGRLVYEEYFDGFDERWGQQLGRVSM